MGSRPPAKLSEKASRQLKRNHVSPKLMSILEKAGSADVTHLDTPTGHAASKPSSSHDTGVKRH